MKNLQMSLKRLFKNKNTVTILGVLAIIVILFIGYKVQINGAVKPVPNIPIAMETIQPRTEITNEMIDYISMASVAVPDNIYTYSSQIIGRYSNYNTIIPKGSMFFKDTVIEKDDLPDSAFIDIPKGEIPYNFPVDIDTTYGNSIFPGNYVDIYMKAEDTNKVMVGKLIENVKILAVKDSEGKHVFEITSESREPAYLIFSLKPELNILLRKASYMGNYQVELFPVPQGQTIAEEENETLVSSQTLKDFINANTVANDEIKAEEELQAEKENQENQENQEQNNTQE